MITAAPTQPLHSELVSHVQHIVDDGHTKTSYWLEYRGKTVGWIICTPLRSLTFTWSFQVHPSCWDWGVAEQLFDVLHNYVSLDRPSLVVMVREYDYELQSFLRQRTFAHFDTMPKYMWLDNDEGRFTPALQYGKRYSPDELLPIILGRFF